MIKVEQTRTEIGKGNCFQACLASIFEIPIEEVPDWNRNGETRWLDLYDRWLAPRGLAMALVNVNPVGPYLEFPKNYDTYWLGGFRSPRHKGLHSVVMKNYQTEWDPHPLREMGVGELVDCTFFVPLNISSWSGHWDNKKDNKNDDQNDDKISWEAGVLVDVEGLNPIKSTLNKDTWLPDTFCGAEEVWKNNGK